MGGDPREPCPSVWGVRGTTMVFDMEPLKGQFIAAPVGDSRAAIPRWAIQLYLVHVHRELLFILLEYHLKPVWHSDDAVGPVHFGTHLRGSSWPWVETSTWWPV